MYKNRQYAMSEPCPKTYKRVKIYVFVHGNSKFNLLNTGSLFFGSYFAEFVGAKIVFSAKKAQNICIYKNNAVFLHSI